MALNGSPYYHGIFPSKHLNAGICFFVTKFSHMSSPKSDICNTNIIRIMKNITYLWVPGMPLWRNVKSRMIRALCS